MSMAKLIPTGFQGNLTVALRGKPFDGSYRVARDKLKTTYQFGSKTIQIKKLTKAAQSQLRLRELVAAQVV